MKSLTTRYGATGMLGILLMLVLITDRDQKYTFYVVTELQLLGTDGFARFSYFYNARRGLLVSLRCRLGAEGYLQ